MLSGAQQRHVRQVAVCNGSSHRLQKTGSEQVISCEQAMCRDTHRATATAAAVASPATPATQASALVHFPESLHVHLKDRPPPVTMLVFSRCQARPPGSASSW